MVINNDINPNVQRAGEAVTPFDGTDLPPLPVMPTPPAPQHLDSVTMGASTLAPEMLLDLPIASSPFEPTWASIEKNYPGTPDWLREAKFGIWVHFGPQAAGESGDWYARNQIALGLRIQ